MVQGPAVWALRAQTDKLEYATEMRRVLEATPNLHIREGMATSVMLSQNDEAVGVETYFGMNFRSKAVVITTGTFMNGKIWVGRKSMPAGRCDVPLPRCWPRTLHPMHLCSGAGSDPIMYVTQGTARIDRASFCFP